MRRLLNMAVGYVREVAAGVAGCWDAFFFTPADPLPLGLIRMATGALLLWSMAVTGLDLHAFLGSDGWADPAVARAFLHDRGGLGWSFWFLVPDGLLVPAYVGALIVLVLFTVGLGSRVTAVLAWMIAVSTARRAPVMLFGFDQVVAIWTLYLAATGTAGQALSVDRWLRRRRAPASAPATVSANIALRLFQLHLCIIYGMAGLAKLQGPAWWDGTAFGLVLLTREFRSVIDVSWLLRYPPAVELATHTTMAFELLYPALIWFRLARPPLLLVAVVLHLGIGLTLGLNEFGLAMIAGNLAFVSAKVLRGGVRSIRDVNTLDY